MRADLFSEGASFQQIPMPGAEVYYLRHFELSQPSDVIMRRLIAEIPWRAERVTVWGKGFPQPRLIAWYGDEGRSYTYSGIQLNPVPWTAILIDIKRKIEATARSGFNSVLLNYYRDNRDSMGFHSDDERELGRQPVIASLSLGEVRTFILKHKTDKSIKPVHLRLASSSVLLMKGETQQNWKHGIAKEARHCAARVNLTFRFIQS